MQSNKGFGHLLPLPVTIELGKDSGTNKVQLMKRLISRLVMLNRIAVEKWVEGPEG